MGVEIERKFLVRADAWRQAADEGVRYRQGYLNRDGRSSVRVRVGGGRARLNIKSGELGMSRLEFEYPVPLADAEEMLARLCHRPLIEKTRYRVRHGAHVWEVDVFEGENAGLVVAEVELEAPEEALELPAWVGEEVTGDPRYYNVCLVEHPYREWGAA